MNAISAHHCRRRACLSLLAAVAMLTIGSSHARAQRCDPGEVLDYETPTALFCTKEEWQVRRQGTTCHVQSADMFPLLGEILSTWKTGTDACRAAQRLYDPSQVSGCGFYSVGTRRLCGERGINLP